MNMTKTVKMGIALCSAVVCMNVFAADDTPVSVKQKLDKVYLMIASFGTIDAMTQVDKWLGEQLQPMQNIASRPTVKPSEEIVDPTLRQETVRINWDERRMEYISTKAEIDRYNEENRNLLRVLRTKTLTDDATRYVPMAKDYLQAAIYRKAKSLISIVDRSNADMNMVEQAISGDDSCALAGASCILTAALGDREESFREVTVNAKGTKVKITTYTQPYTGKVRDLKGNILFSFSGAADVQLRVNNIVTSTHVDPARQLMEKVSDQIADRVLSFFTTVLTFKVKAPKGFDADDAVVMLDGKEVDFEDDLRVFAIEHEVNAELDGCKAIRRKISIENEMPEKTVKLNFKALSPSTSAASAGTKDAE